jgi:hypothetical protein
MRNTIKRNSEQKITKQFLKLKSCKNQPAAFLATVPSMIRTTIRKAATKPPFEQLFENPDNYFGLYGLSSNNYFSKMILFDINDNIVQM